MSATSMHLRDPIREFLAKSSRRSDNTPHVHTPSEEPYLEPCPLCGTVAALFEVRTDAVTRCMCWYCYAASRPTAPFVPVPRFIVDNPNDRERTYAAISEAGCVSPSTVWRIFNVEGWALRQRAAEGLMRGGVTMRALWRLALVRPTMLTRARQALGLQPKQVNDSLGWERDAYPKLERGITGVIATEKADEVLTLFGRTSTDFGACAKQAPI